MDLQALVDAIGKATSDTRGDYHLTLMGAVEAVAGAPDDAPIQFEDGSFPGEAMSYRGYYSDLAFPTSPTPMNVGQFRRACSDAIGSTFEGYKGGNFTMHDRTPLWCAEYGGCGPAVMGIEKRDDGFVLITKEIA